MYCGLRRFLIYLKMAVKDKSIEELSLSFANMLKESNNCVFYTGAGISTSAAIPDFRSPSGLYEQFKNSGTIPSCADMTEVRPAYPHMAIKALVEANHVRHVVSQNCDGLHLRSGLPSELLSEIHGNMFIEMCMSCDPPTTYVRHFDTTQGTGFRRHKVVGAEQRPCKKCGGYAYLYDSVVHCGEFARHEASRPYRWTEAAVAAQKADLIVCIGTSLAVLKSYATLWKALKQRKDRAKLVIINIGPTCKDKQATLVINGQCEEVLKTVVKRLGVTVPEYNPANDPIHLASITGALLPSPAINSLPQRCPNSPTAAMPGWMRATVEQLRRAREKSRRSRRVSVFGSRKRSSIKRT